MANETTVVKEAEVLLSKDDEALLLEIGLRQRAIQADPAHGDDPHLQIEYDSTHMGLIDNIKLLGRRIMTRWNKELYGVICDKKPSGVTETTEDKKVRDDLLKALNLGDAAVITAVVTGLMALGAPAAIAAPVAPFLVRKFIMPARDELCDAWGQAITAY